jgi:hypothetical protein
MEEATRKHRRIQKDDFNTGLAQIPTYLPTYLPTHLPTYLPIYLWLYSPLLDLGRFFSFSSFCAVGRTAWTEDQPVARPLPAHRIAHTQTPTPQVRFQPTIPVFERAKTFRALDWAAIVIGSYDFIRQHKWVINLVIELRNSFADTFPNSQFTEPLFRKRTILKVGIYTTHSRWFPFNKNSYRKPQLVVNV